MHVGIANPQWQGKRSRHSRCMRNPQCFVSGERHLTGMPAAVSLTKAGPICRNLELTSHVKITHIAKGLFHCGSHMTEPHQNTSMRGHVHNYCDALLLAPWYHRFHLTGVVLVILTQLQICLTIINTDVYSCIWLHVIHDSFRCSCIVMQLLITVDMKLLCMFDQVLNPTFS